MVNNLQLGELSLSYLCCVKGDYLMTQKTGKKKRKERHNIQISFIPNNPLQQMIRIFKFQTPE